MTVVEVNYGDSFLFRPSGKSSSNGSLLAKGPLCVTSVAKVLKEGLDLIIKQGLGPAEGVRVIKMDGVRRRLGEKPSNLRTCGLGECNVKRLWRWRRVLSKTCRTV